MVALKSSRFLLINLIYCSPCACNPAAIGCGQWLLPEGSSTWICYVKASLVLAALRTAFFRWPLETRGPLAGYTLHAPDAVLTPALLALLPGALAVLSRQCADC
jgi:hypothetical protein